MYRHGLSYTTFEYSNLRLSEPAITGAEIEVVITVTIKNTGTIAGSEVVQAYVTLPSTSDLTHPPLSLRAFTKVRDLSAGKSEEVTMKLDKYAVSYWEDRISKWVAERGQYTVRVGKSSAPEALLLEGKFTVDKTFEWNGL